MSDSPIGSSQQVEPEHRTPDLMDIDPLIANLKALHEETRSDDDDDGQPSTSAKRKDSRADGIVIHQKKYSDPGRFLWIWLLGVRVPALSIDGEPHLPIEILDDMLTKKDKKDQMSFQNLLRYKNVYIRMASPSQFRAVMEKSKECENLNITSLSLMSRSDIERIMGELRLESMLTLAEHDNWDISDRVHVVHVNFIDYCSEWLESDDLEEDVMQSGTHGYWYKNRRNMRCIECQHCEGKFTPTDFIMHHHYPIKPSGFVHTGCNSFQWIRLIEVFDKSNENLEAWNKFVLNSHRAGKREYDEAAPHQAPPKRPAMETPVPVAADNGWEADEEEEGEEIVDRDADIEKCKLRNKKKMENLHIADFLGPSGSKGLKPRNKFEAVIIEQLNKMDDAALEALFLKSPEEYNLWVKESDFTHKVVTQQQEWKAKMKDPNFKSRASANFDVSKGEFDNMRHFDNASKATRQEIQQLAEQFANLDRDAKLLTPMEFVLREHALLKNVSADAIRVLCNRPPLPPLPPPPPPPKPKPAPVQPISLGNINFVALAQQLIASGIKLPLPIVTPPVVSTPAPVITPIPAALPISPNSDFLKQQLSTAMSSPALLSLYPKLTAGAYEQLAQFIKTTTVKN
ncbi:Ski protein homolog [Caenorhabditis elegans]|uniref:Ski protein homolog n=1 Tax=Caenorhabditis elegans TaxID=6239 RepID=DAF5_CAEEL|nr:Ski protein homolog [Caenorhabditis elegans]G5EDM7.1 RecName: Full=Ski protein homolog; AltName: Full=Abnormal dauer formation protein 5 [Caenorhabditis elegans]AAR00670.1 abnormal DAuer Formation DAF-5, a Ski oncogene homolog involved in a neuronal TGF beta pathway (71.0 kD) (daf-5) [Caenorhabditis elegans]CAB03453.1 Ski protein homolog [Caenorhabditis elegans]|eukprot:NP_496941.1 Uncharacterized protein CELE_W01G7.1 [Caenorhabditis elegans]